MKETNGPQRSVGEWDIGAQLGRGAFAVVWKAQHRQTTQEAAVKEIDVEKLNSRLRQSLESEVSILKRVSHNNIVKLYQVIEEGTKLYLIMEYCSGGDLAGLIRAEKRLPEEGARHIMQQLASGLKEMASRNLVHRDLKPQNLLLSHKGPDAVLKIADFGFARALQPQRMAETLCGSPLYMAPEILHHHKYDAKADLWSIGAVLFEVISGKPPFDAINQFQLLRNIERREATLPPDIAMETSTDCQNLISSLLKRNPIERISFEEFFRHPWIDPSSSRTQHSSAAANALSLCRARSTSSIPTQVVGFQRSGDLPAVALNNPQATPVSQLSEQLRPQRRNSLELPASSSSPHLLSTHDDVHGEIAAADSLPSPLIPTPQAHTTVFTSREADEEEEEDEDEDDYVLVDTSSRSSPALQVAAQTHEPVLPEVSPPQDIFSLDAAAKPAVAVKRALLSQSEMYNEVVQSLERLAMIGHRKEDCVALRLASLHLLQRQENSRELLTVILHKSEEDIEALQKGGAPPVHLPNPWILLYKGALSWARDAALDELLGQTQQSMDGYARAAVALDFLHMASQDASLQPPFPPQNKDSLLQCIQAIHGRIVS